MRSFFKFVLATIVGIFITTFLFFILFFATISIIGFSSDKNDTNIKKNSILTIGSKISIIENPNEDNENFFDLSSLKNNKQAVNIQDVINAINEAKNDNNIKGLSIETDNISAGITQIDDLRNAILDFKKSGKFVYAYGNIVSQNAYLLGSVADKYFLNPAGSIDLKGMASEVVFMKDFADKYGIGIHVIRHGKFKAAVEPFLRNNISDENKEQLSTLLNDIWGNASKKMATARGIDSLSFQKATDSLYGMIPDNCIEYKLADQLLQKSQYNDFIKNKLKISNDDDLNKVSISDYIDSIDKDNADDEVAVLYASGEIKNGDELNGISSKRYIKYIQDLKNNDDVKAVVLRVNSPGGDANAADEILFELQQLKLKKPLIISFGDYAASGGYYISMAGQKIFAEPNCVTGSIGVFGTIFDAKELANRNGIRSDVVETNANAQTGSLIAGIPNSTLAIVQKSVEKTYKRFVYFVTQNRHKTFEQIDAVAGGRVWSGKRAKEIGLVDDLGSLNDAIKYAAKQAHLKNYSVTSYPEKSSPFKEFFNDTEDSGLDSYLMKLKLGDKYQLYKTFLDFNNNNQHIFMKSNIKVNF
ncbi:signal peptide peptidase SppA [Riemerella columbipharyngis]|uniref:Protease-4 n=1 Tax=Riemerella columbipharyngis TaxID=1071918 RepID=A0A1G7EFQ6_9FLAO|nr:signal peptide peptidase SppA [Riemerella columbipharyngis]SDE62255.1 protease-4 [Riemerella columbipharyngis]